MPSLRNKVTGSVVNVSDETAARLGSQWVPVDAPKKEPTKKGADAPEGDK